MKALVTGGAGFLGLYIVEQLLERGDSVTVFARGDYPKLREMGVELIRGDIQVLSEIKKACKDMDIVFHAAAKTNFWGNYEDFYNINVTGTKNVIAACREQGVPKLVNSSSASTIFDGKDHNGPDESIPYPTRYLNHYGPTKALAEKLVQEANGPNLCTVSIRPHAVFGPRDPHILPRLLKIAKSGKLPQIGDGKNKIDVTYVEDAAMAHLMAADKLHPGSPVAGSIYFISQDDPVVLWPWIKKILKGLNFPPIKRKISPLLIYKIAGILEFLYRLFGLKGEPRVSRTSAAELYLNHYYDISRAKNDFNYETRYSLDEALEKTIEYFKNINFYK